MLTLIIFWLAADLIAEEPTVIEPDGKIDYLRQIKPILAEKCYACHGTLKQKAKLRLETLSLMLKGGKNGPTIVKGNPAGSLLLQKVTTKDRDERMPPEGEGSALSDAQVEILKRWIQQGAPAPEEAIPLAPTEHWSFQEIEKPSLPKLKNSILKSSNPIDLLLEAKRLKLNLKTLPLQDKSLAIRRLYLGLTGLPPTLKQLDDPRPWEEIVEEQLSSPHHGERWGRHWMDIWRYSDWYGLGAQLRNSQKHMWRWRDWIVNSLNKDKGYDRMILEMLAGDEIDPTNLEAIQGTAFLARNYYLFNRTTWIDSTIEHTSKALFGLTLNCAKCHDHKYDPLSQEDYYTFRALFEPHQARLDPVPGTLNLEQDGLPRVFDDHLTAPTYHHIKGDPKNIDKSKRYQPSVPQIFTSFQPAIREVELPRFAYAPMVRDYVREALLKDIETNIEKAQTELAKAKNEFEKFKLESKSIKQSPPKPKHKSETKKPKDETPQFVFEDDFSKARSQDWKIEGKGWVYKNGALHQTEVNRSQYQVRFQHKLPKDFEMECRYTTTGGATFKSVSFRFDQSNDKTYENSVYSSAHAPGPKIQASPLRNGKNSFPEKGRIGYPVKVGKPYTIKLQVRDRLVNVYMDGKLVLVYSFPDRRPKGNFALSVFDGLAAFDHIKIRSLPGSMKLEGKAPVPTKDIKDPKVKFELAQLRLQAETTRLQSLKDRIKVHEQLNSSTSQEDKNALRRQAAKSEAEELKAKAEYELLAHQNDPKKLDQAQKTLVRSKNRFKEIEQGKFNFTAIKVTRKALETPAHKNSQYPAVYAHKSTGRRSALANWAISKKNPLTARVAVNHVWLRHFGKPLVENVFDFGLRTRAPLHQDALDYLAKEFMDSGWSFRHLHRLIVTSKTYQLSTSSQQAHQETQARDPENKYYWRMNSRRMESQLVRDSLLSLAQKLDLKLGGPSINPGTSNRRSLYFKHDRDHQDLFLKKFDDADHLQCYRRQESIVPQQALALANSKLTLDMVGEIIELLQKQTPPNDALSFINRSFKLILGRLPNKEEKQICLNLLHNIDPSSSPPLSTKAKTNIKNLVRRKVIMIFALINHNDFITIR